VLFVVVAITALLFSGKYMSRHQGSANAGFQDSGARPAIGTTAPDFTLKVLGEKGKTLQLSQLKGKAVLINIWATWCEPCKVELPWLVELQKKYGPQGLQILGVAEDESGEKTIMAFAQKMGLNYPILQGTNSVGDLYPSEGLPLSVYVDRSGTVVFRAVGLVSESVMEDAIKKSLGQGGGNPNTNTTSTK
jgi:cytochrome c biogenesis protein CcmG/thiol:disulfide interchange protein DsbE